MAVHFHTGAGGGSYFNVGGSNPMLLEPLLNDPSLRKTNFVMLQAAGPSLARKPRCSTKPNAYLDFSAQTYMNYPRDVAKTSAPGWNMFRKGAVRHRRLPYAPPAAAGKRSAYVANSSGREALGRALTGMLRDREIPRARLQLARMVLRDKPANCSLKRPASPPQGSKASRGPSPSVLPAQSSYAQSMHILCRLKRWRETHGQDLIEYALMAGFLSVAAGAVLPSAGPIISTIFSRVASQLAKASTQGS